LKPPYPLMALALAVSAYLDPGPDGFGRAYQASGPSPVSLVSSPVAPSNAPIPPSPLPMAAPGECPCGSECDCWPCRCEPSRLGDPAPWLAASLSILMTSPEPSMTYLDYRWDVRWVRADGGVVRIRSELQLTLPPTSGTLPFPPVPSGELPSAQR
jgi:hypothetical protein